MSAIKRIYLRYMEYTSKIARSGCQQLYSTFHRPPKIVKILRYTQNANLYNTAFLFWAKTICESCSEARAFQKCRNFLLYPKSALVLKLSYSIGPVLATPFLPLFLAHLYIEFCQIFLGIWITDCIKNRIHIFSRI